MGTQEQGGAQEALVAQSWSATLKPLSKGSGAPGLQSCEWAPSRAVQGWLAPICTDRWLSERRARQGGGVMEALVWSSPMLLGEAVTLGLTDGAGVAVPGPWGSCRSSVYQCPVRRLPCWPGPTQKALLHLDPIPRRALTGKGSRDDEPGASS